MIGRQIGQQRLLGGAIDQQPLVGELPGPRPNLDERETAIGQCRLQIALEIRIQRRAGRFSGRAGDQQRIDLVRLLNHLGQGFGGDEGVLRQLLSRPQSKSAQPLGRNHGTDGQPPTAGRLGFAAQRAIGRNQVGPANLQQHFVPRPGGQRLGQRPIEHDFVGANWFGRSARSQLAELRAADDRDFAGAVRVLFGRMLEIARNEDCRDDRIAVREIGGRRQAVGQITVEKMIGDENLVDPAQAVDGQMGQALADRIAHAQGAGQNRGRGGDAQRQRQVGPPMIGQAAREQNPTRHGQVTRAKKRGARVETQPRLARPEPIPIGRRMLS